MKIKCKLPIQVFLILTTQLAAYTIAAPLPTPPPVSVLESGDLIWPKKPGKFVPYDSKPGVETQETAVQWEKEKQQHLDMLRSKPTLSPEEAARLNQLSSMTYREFKAQYFGGLQPSEPTTFGTGGFYTGHVGIIRISNGVPSVVEAMDGIGVQEVPYKKWLEDRPGEIFWLGRLKAVPPERRAAIAEWAMTQLKKPYNFWKFDLSDETAFYCSKLAWLSILTVAGFAPDDNPNPKRALWYSPKQLMNSKHVDLKVSPGEYGSR